MVVLLIVTAIYTDIQITAQSPADTILPSFQVPAECVGMSSSNDVARCKAALERVRGNYAGPYTGVIPAGCVNPSSQSEIDRCLREIKRNSPSSEVAGTIVFPEQDCSRDGIFVYNGQTLTLVELLRRHPHVFRQSVGQTGTLTAPYTWNPLKKCCSWRQVWVLKHVPYYMCRDRNNPNPQCGWVYVWEYVQESRCSRSIWVWDDC